ncbi:Trichothecene efflux pump TRI12 [Paramyrothecium foliicola]|nr:Trichothecene efflux pump TRI12 [Paramyrothecium foliicola]
MIPCYRNPLSLLSRLGVSAANRITVREVVSPTTTIPESLLCYVNMAVPEEVLNIDPNDGDKLRAKALTADVNDLPEGYYRSPRMIGTFISIALNLVATYFAFQASAAAISNISADVGVSKNTSLFSTVWTTGQAICILLMGRLTDRFGRRPFFMLTNVLGLIGGIVACTANSMETLIGAQVLLGISAGQGGASPLFVGELMSNKHKFVGAVIIAFPNVVATGFGPVIGQILGNQGKWRWIYYIYIIKMTIASLLAFFFYHPPSFVQLHGKKISKRQELAKVDWIGVFLLTAGLTLFLLGISWGGQPDNAWDSAKILGLLISGGVTLVSFILFECFAKIERPIIPMHFFRDLRGFTCLVLVSSTMGVMNLALFIMYPQQVVNIFGSTASGWREIAWMSSTAAFGIWAGILILGSLFHVIRRIKWQLFAVAAWEVAFLGAMSSVNRHNKSAAIALSFFTGFVVGFAQDVTMLVVQYIVDDDDLGAAFGIVAGSRSVFGSIFTAAFIAIYTNKFPGQLQSKLIPAVSEAGLPESSIPDLLGAIQSGVPQAIGAVPGMTPALAKVTADAMADSYAASYAYVYYFAIALGVIAMGAGLFSRDFDRYMTNHVSHQIYKKSEADKDPLDSSSSNCSREQVYAEEK